MIHHPTLLVHPAIQEAHIILLQAVGRNRSNNGHCQIQARHDIDAINCWLNEYRDSPDTYRTYQREVKRLLLWCAFSAKKALSDLTRDDFAQYSLFLTNPQPASFWCGPRSKKLEHWKPFVGPLSQSACATAMTVINSLMTYLVQADYLARNPLSLIRKKVSAFAQATQKLQSMKRSLEIDEIQALLQTVEALPENTPASLFMKWRSQFLIPLLMLTGLRAHEVAKLHWHDFRLIQNRWWLMVLGKGKKWRLIPVTNELLTLIKHYRQKLNKPPYPLQHDDSPIFTSHVKIDKQAKPLSIRRINMLVRELAVSAAEQFKDQPDKYQKLLYVSVHGFRHYYASLQDKAGIARTIIRDNLGHTSVSTTEIYLHSAEVERHKALQDIRILSDLHGN